MCDDKAGLSFHEPLHRRLNLNLGSSIHIGSGLIQDQDLRIEKEGTGYPSRP